MRLQTILTITGTILCLEGCTSPSLPTYRYLTDTHFATTDSIIVLENWFSPMSDPNLAYRICIENNGTMQCEAIVPQIDSLVRLVITRDQFMEVLVLLDKVNFFTSLEQDLLNGPYTYHASDRIQIVAKLGTKQKQIGCASGCKQSTGGERYQSLINHINSLAPKGWIQFLRSQIPSVPSTGFY